MPERRLDFIQLHQYYKWAKGISECLHVEATVVDFVRTHLQNEGMKTRAKHIQKRPNTFVFNVR